MIDYCYPLHYQFLRTYNFLSFSFLQQLDNRFRCECIYNTYKSDLRYFVEKSIDEVKDFADKKQMALGIDSVTLTDAIDNRLILHNVCYIPGNEDRIISMMKFRREHKIEFEFTGLEIFCMSIIKDFNLTGQSVNDILYTTIPQIQAIVANVAANVVVIRDTIKRQINEVSSDMDFASVISETSEHLRTHTIFQKASSH